MDSGGLPRQRVSHYRLLGRLGAGGMGEVYAAFDETLKRRVALKAIRAEHRLNDESKARFVREARLLSQLDHPHVCRAYDYIEEEDAEWLVLELVDGRNLRDAMADGLDAAGRFRVAEQMASALVAAHAAGVVHRDLKPGNVMVTSAGDAKVLDFGLAHAVDIVEQPRHGPDGGGEPAWPTDTDAETTQTAIPAPAPAPGQARALDESIFRTQGGSISGTVAYMSPEQAVGSPATTASDMYSFGLLLQELFSGRRSYDPTLTAAELLEQARAGRSLDPQGMSADLSALVRRLKALAPSRRPTAVDTLDRLRWIREKPARRLRWLAAAALLIGLSLGAVKYTFDLARERTRAVAARDDADRRRDQAETLIGFLLGDLRKKLEPVGRLDILDDVGASAMDYFAAVPESALTDEEVLRRSKALYQIGEVRIAQGNLEAAVAPLEDSLRLAQALVQRVPDDGDRIFEVSQSHYWVGYVHWRRRDLDAAQRHFQAYVDAAERLVVLAPTRREWRQEVAYANSNIASVLEARGALDEALTRFRASLAIEEALLAEAPDDLDLLRSVASSHNAIGAVLRSSGHLADAEAEYRTELRLLEPVVARQPDNATWQNRLAVSHSSLGDMRAARGDAPAARARYRQALEVSEALVRRDPANGAWRRELARSAFKLGRSLTTVAPGDAQPLLDRAVDLLGTLSAGDPTNGGWRRDLAEARFALGVVLARRGNLDAATREADAMVAATTGPAPGDDRFDARLQSLAQALHARIRTARGDRAMAIAAWERSLAAIAPAARGSRDFALLEVWAEALLQLGRKSEAAPVLDLLRAIGYNPVLPDSALTSGLRLPVHARPQEGRQG